MKKTEELREADKRHLWHPFTQMKEWFEEDFPVIEKGRGNYLIDTEGRRYLDGFSSLWVNVHGHRKKEIDRAVREQLRKIAHSTLLGLANPPSIELAEKLVALAPPGLTRVFYSDNGSTAVEIAMKMSFQYRAQSRKKEDRRKKKFIAFTGAYHGDTVGAMSVGEIDVFVKRFRPLLFDALRSPYPYCYRCPLGEKYPDCGTACLGEFERIVEKNHEEITACIIEPLVQGAAGMVVSPPGFLRGVRRITGKYDIHLIADEVATGFGRTGAMFACEHEKVRPDFLCLAKGITGGYLPLAATLTTEKIFRAFLGRYEEYRAFFHGHTYTGNPLGCAAAIANLKIFEKEKVIEGLDEKVKRFGRLLTGLGELDHVGDVRYRGLMAGIELVENKKTKKPYKPGLRTGRRVCMRAREKGLMIRPIGDTIILIPPLGITLREIETMVEIVKDSIVEETG